MGYVTGFIIRHCNKDIILSNTPLYDQILYLYYTRPNGNINERIIYTVDYVL
jgi:hypothetical protein